MAGISILSLEMGLVNVFGLTVAKNFLLSLPLFLQIILQASMAMEGLKVVGDFSKKRFHEIAAALLLALVVGGGASQGQGRGSNRSLTNRNGRSMKGSHHCHDHSQYKEGDGLHSWTFFGDINVFAAVVQRK